MKTICKRSNIDNRSVYFPNLNLIKNTIVITIILAIFLNPIPIQTAKIRKPQKSLSISAKENIKNNPNKALTNFGKYL